MYSIIIFNVIANYLRLSNFFSINFKFVPKLLISIGQGISDGSTFAHSTEAKPHMYPWQIVLLKRNYAVCSGALINKMWALTTAHCISNIDQSLMTVTLGDYNIDKSEGTEQTVKADKVYIHPHFNVSTTDNDIALIKFEKPITFSWAIQPIALPLADHDINTGTFCVVSGWGKRSLTAEDRPDILRQAVIPIVSNNECNLPISYKGEVTERMLCAGYKYGGPDACTGDSGGPLSCLATSEKAKQKWLLAGLVSWGSRCGAPFKYGVYTRVSYFRDWIEDTVNDPTLSLSFL